MPKEFIVSEATLQAIGNYLSMQPYREVAGLIAALSQVKPADQPQQDQPKTEA